MLQFIVSRSLRLRVVVVALAAVLVIVGFARVREVPLDVFPEFAPPLVEIQTEAPGLTSSEVESLVTLPLESALLGLPWVKTVRSKSVLGLSSVVLILDRKSDVIRARQLVQEHLALAASRLPDVARAPVILSPLSSTSRVMKIGLTSKALSQVELSTLACWTIRPRLMAVPGVANVAIWGQRDHELQVVVDPERLAALGLSLGDVTRAAGDAVSVRTGGFVDTPNQRLAIRHVQSALSADDLARTVVAVRDGSTLRLGDVARVESGYPPPIGSAVVNDELGLLLIVEKQPWGNTLAVTRGVESALDSLRTSLEGVDVDRAIFRPATFIETALANLRHSLWNACGLVSLVLILFLFDGRAAIISITAIPLSLVAASLALAWWGQTLNTMVLAGLVIALGEVVDDAIIDVENIARRLRGESAAPSPARAFEVVLRASLEVRSAVVFGSLIVALVLLPVFTLGGLAGAFFEPLALAYIVAILASLAVALTVTPALALMLLPRGSRRTEDAFLPRWLKRVYAAALPGLQRHWRAVAALFVIALAAAGFGYAKLGEELLPSFQERDFLMHWVEKPGTSLEAVERVTLRVSRELRRVPGVKSFGSHIGRAEVADEVVGPNFAELWISLDPEVPYAPTVARVQEVVDGYPGLYRDLLTYLKERIKEVLTGASASVVVRVFGADLDALREEAQGVARALAGVSGVADLKVEAQALVPQIELELRLDAAARAGLRASDVRSAVSTLVSGTRVGQVFDGHTIVDVAVIGERARYADPVALSELLLDTPSGRRVRLAEVCDLRIVPTPNEIKRENASRRIDVTCNVAGRDLGSVAREIEQRVQGLQLARGSRAELLGEFAERQAAQRTLLGTALLSLLGIVLLLHAEFRSWRLALMVVFTLPLALIGGVAGAWLGGGVLSLGSLIGFVTVLGIAARNSIMLLSHYRHLERVEGEPLGPALVMRGSLERLTPILMTALCAALALLPLIWAGNRPGQEIEHPLAIVVVGGVVTSTLACLLLLPGLYARFAVRAADAEG